MDWGLDHARRSFQVIRVYIIKICRTTIYWEQKRVVLLERCIVSNAVVLIRTILIFGILLAQSTIRRLSLQMFTVTSFVWQPIAIQAIKDM
eukprot:gene26411-35057_t